MMCHRIVNSLFNSCTYILHEAENSNAILIDCGDSEPIMKYLADHQLKLSMVFLTHAHYDHVYGLKNIVSQFPQCIVCGSKETLIDLKDPFANLSFYHEDEFIFDFQNVRQIEDECFHVDGFESVIECMSTPGHNMGSMSFIFENHIFTGDAYIPGKKTVTKLNGNEELSMQSVKFILDLSEQRNLLIQPGHLSSKS